MRYKQVFYRYSFENGNKIAISTRVIDKYDEIAHYENWLYDKSLERKPIVFEEGVIYSDDFDHKDEYLVVDEEYYHD